MTFSAGWLEVPPSERIGKTPKELGNLGCEITALAVHHATDVLVAGQPNGGVALYDPAQTKSVKNLPAHSQVVTRVVFTAKGDRFLSSSIDGDVAIWRTDGEPLTRIRVGDPVLAMALSIDDKFLATGGADRVLRVWDLERGEQVSAFPPQADGITACGWVGKDQLVTADETGGMWVWEPFQGRLLKRWQGHDQPVPQLLVSRRGAWYATCSWDKTVKVWNFGHKEKFSLPPASEPVTSLALSEDETILAATCWDGMVRCFNLADGSLRDDFKASGRALTACAMPPGWNALVTGDDNGELRAWSLSEVGVKRFVHRHDGEVYGLAYTPDNAHALSVGWDGQLKVWDRTTHSEAGYIQIHEEPAACVAAGPDNAYWAVGGHDGAVKLWDVMAQNFEASIQAHKRCVSCLRIMPGGERIVTGSWDLKLKLLSLRTQLVEMSFDGHNKEVTCCDVSLDGRRLVSGSADETARVWALDVPAEHGRCLLLLEGHRGPVLCCGFAPDGRHVVTGGRDGNVLVWSADRLGEPRLLSGHREEVTACGFTPDGHVLLTADRAGMVMFWNAESWTPYGAAQHDTAVLTLAVAPDGTQAAIGDKLGNVRFLQLDYAPGPLWVAAASHRKKASLWRYGSPDTERYRTACPYCGHGEEHGQQKLGDVHRCPKCGHSVRVCPRSLAQLVF